MGHHKADHNPMAKEFKVGKDNEAKQAEAAGSAEIPMDSTKQTAESDSSSRQPRLQHRLHELQVAGNGALTDLRSGFGSAAKEVRSGVGTAISQIRRSMTKAAERFDGVLPRIPKIGERRKAH